MKGSLGQPYVQSSKAIQRLFPLIGKAATYPTAMDSDIQSAGEIPPSKEAPSDAKVTIGTAHRVTEEELVRYRPRTIVGRMAEIRNLQSEDRIKLDALTARLEHFVNADPARLLDPQLIRPCPWGGRARSSTPISLETALTSSMQAMGINVQPIKVRRLTTDEIAAGVATAGKHWEYELVFGVRRLTICAELGLRVSAVICSLDLRDAFIESMLEKQGASPSLSPHDLGGMYHWALETQLFPSRRRLADMLDTPASEVEKAITIARLPLQVIEAFRAPADIRPNWAAPLARAVDLDGAAVLTKAKQLRDLAAKLPSVEVFRQLCER